MRPATSLIGVRSGSPPLCSSVSYAKQFAPVFITPCVSSRSAARWKYVNRVWPRRISDHSCLSGSFTLSTRSLAANTDFASGAILAPAFS
jgi:hypothetical protein